MPSSAYTNFKKNAKQVDRLLDAFIAMRPPTPGRKHLDHLTRAAMIFLCASWEVYIEQILFDSGSIITQRINSPDKLPLEVKKTISTKIKNAKDEIEPISFCTDWKIYFLKLIEDITSNLNTPKNGNVTELFHKYLGIEGNILRVEVPCLNKINEFVKIRGDIAHNVFAEDYVTSELVNEFYTLIKKLVIEIEILLWNYLPKVTDGRRPWQNTY